MLLIVCRLIVFFIVLYIVEACKDGYRRSISLENIQRIADALEIETYKLFLEDYDERKD